LVYRLVIDPTQNQEQKIYLTPQQQHYLKRVLRLPEGARFVVLDGRGNTWIAQLSGTSAEILQSLLESTELPLPATLMVALPKGNGFEEILRCCTELGVTNFMPVLSERTLLKPSPHKVQRWRKIIQEAAEQSERQIVPQIEEPLPFQAALATIENCQADCYLAVTRTPADHLLNYLENPPSQPILIATGPEGGWTPQEVDRAIGIGFQPVSLGKRIFRAITAPIVALSLIAASLEKAEGRRQKAEGRR
jgi:16S rRNA (uracil1498-N3)-methyltransferase